MSVVLGIDYGERRLGLAIGDTNTGLAFPLRVVAVRSEGESLAAVRGACAERKVERVVLGLPLDMNGSRGAQARVVEAFAGRLAKALAMPVELWDERLTSKQAERALLEADLSRKRRREIQDKLAAQSLLQSFLDACSARASDETPTP